MSRALGLCLVFYIAAFLITRHHPLAMPHGALLLMLYCGPYLFGLLCVLFPRQISDYAGSRTGGRLARHFTPLIVAAGGWLLLVLIEPARACVSSLVHELASR